MNDIFGFQLTDDYQNGPYYRSDTHPFFIKYSFCLPFAERAPFSTLADLWDLACVLLYAVTVQTNTPHLLTHTKPTETRFFASPLIYIHIIF